MEKEEDLASSTDEPLKRASPHQREFGRSERESLSSMLQKRNMK
jgi:hypothetical protein